MTHWTLNALGKTLTCGFGTRHNDRRALAYSLTSAQDQARHADSDPTSAAYFDAMVSGMVKVGWNSTWSGHVGPRSVPPSESLVTSVVGELEAKLPPGLVATPHPIFAALSKRLSTPGDLPPDVTALLDRWWRALGTTESAKSMTVGPLVRILTIPLVVLAVTSIRGEVSSWKDLFAPTATPLAYRTQITWMTLDLSTYARHRTELEARLKHRVEADIGEAQLNLR